jgi:hypothetical protein
MIDPTRSKDSPVMRFPGSCCLLPLFLLAACSPPAPEPPAEATAGPEAAPSTLDAAEALQGDWRIVRGVPAPWAADAPLDGDVVGRQLTFNANDVLGPGVLACAGASYETTLTTAEGLFQGALPAPVHEHAATLGLVDMPVLGLRVSCDSGVFDFHQVDDDGLLFALDNVVWTLDRSPGARAVDGAPEAQVQALLERHFAGDMGFDADTVAHKRELLDPSLAAAMEAFLARPVDADEAPAINGDPFTDSQEYPTRFVVGQAAFDNGAAQVPVLFSDGRRERGVTYQLQRGAEGVWRVVDVRYEDGSALAAMLGE